MALPAYAVVHLTYTLPPAALLTLIAYPLATRLDAFRLTFLLLIALISTTPWDSYLVSTGVWSYPPDAVMGSFLSVPYEEYFFFVIQTYITSIIYILLAKPIFHPAFLAEPGSTVGSGKLKHAWVGAFGQMFVAAIVGYGIGLFKNGGEGTYLGLILIWAGPFVFLLWSLSYVHILSLPIRNTLLPIMLPTIYLWIVDTFALGRGTWIIAPGTKTGLYLWPSLEIEEAIFFLVTNTLIVFGHIAIDHALAILTACPTIFPHIPYPPSPTLLTRALLVSPTAYDWDRIRGMRDAVLTLRRKSRSFLLASAVFEGPLRADLLLLYSFCRVADDLIDDAATPAVAKDALFKLQGFLECAYSTSEVEKLRGYVTSNFPPSTHSAMLLLPTSILPRAPLDELLEGFASDLRFADAAAGDPVIHTEDDLALYGRRVAGTVGELCVVLVAHHAGLPPDAAVLSAASSAGIALQYVNVTRDVFVDARINRVYIPAEWLPAEGTVGIRDARRRLLSRAFTLYKGARPSVELLPSAWGARRGVRVAVEAYMEIGRVLQERLALGGDANADVHEGKATVPTRRRAWTAWRALAGL